MNIGLFIAHLKMKDSIITLLCDVPLIAPNVCCIPSDFWREEAIWPQWQQWLCWPYQPPRPGATKPFTSWDPHWGPGTCLHPFPGDGLWNWSRYWVQKPTLLEIRLCLPPWNMLSWCLLYNSLCIYSNEENKTAEQWKIFRHQLGHL